MGLVASWMVPLGGVLAFIILFQDICGRWVHLVPVVMLLVAGIFWQYGSGQNDPFLQMTVNFAFITLLVGIVWSYYRISGRGNVINSGLGIGDILVFYALATWFDTWGFFFMFVTGHLSILFFALLGILTGRLRKDFPIPLAGLLAGWAAIWWLAKWLDWFCLCL